MLENLLNVAQQVLILFLLIGVGFICGKIKLLNAATVKGMTDFVLMIVIPCLTVKSFQKSYDPEMLVSLGIAVLAAIGVHLLSILLGRVLLRDADKSRERVMRFSLIFSNAVFMGAPLQQAILGDEGVFYGAAYSAVFNLFLWTYGIILMTGQAGDSLPEPETDGGKRRRKSRPGVISWKSVLLNPGIIGLFIGVALFLCSCTLPEVVAAPIGHLAALNTPVPMIIVGYHLSNANLLSVLKNPRVYLTIGLRLILVPLITLEAFLLCGIRGTMMIAIVIASSTPVGATVSMFATKYRQDVGLSVNLTALSTLLSILTMPVIVSLAQMAS